ncbi:hypothetical protein [Methylomicrobium sp. Wu6]|uniref:hypothetical protein n=1 Tax=Methylomicrobium sp. Wu6 TaxID=3107928 RepID=UPI002DD6531D|nr:hypothetical protein [Methylomicrobium sp. Wu6]MEC4748008.1 hypothetical protein [Methylomicrobium sp. Wu6]
MPIILYNIFQTDQYAAFSVCGSSEFDKIVDMIQLWALKALFRGTTARMQEAGQRQELLPRGEGIKTRQKVFCPPSAIAPEASTVGNLFLLYSCSRYSKPLLKGECTVF